MASITVQKDILLYPKQVAFLKSTALFRAFAAGISSGKSYVGAYDVIRRAKPGRLYMVVAPTYRLMADSSFRSMKDLVLSLGIAEAAQIVGGDTPHIILRNGAEILFRTGEKPELLRGPNLSGAWLDEASLMKQDVFDIMIGRLRQAGEMGWLTATFTPKGRAHWTYKTFGTGGKDVELIEASTYENPFNPKEFFETIKNKYTSKQIDQELKGVFLVDGGNHFCPGLWPRYTDIGDAYRIQLGSGQWKTYLYRDCTIIVGFDLAQNKPNRSKAKDLTQDKTDFCAFVVCALTQDGNLFILDCVNDRIRTEGKAPRLAEICRRWRPWIVASDDDMIVDGLMLDFRRQRDIPEIKILPINGKGKVTRATPAIIRGENGLIFLPQKKADGREEPWMETFTDNISSFTGIDDDHDDVPDALGIVGRVADDLKGDGREEPMPDILTPARDLFGFS